jgi:hypothetical protein
MVFSPSNKIKCESNTQYYNILNEEKQERQSRELVDTSTDNMVRRNDYLCTDVDVEDGMNQKCGLHGE